MKRGLNIKLIVFLSLIFVSFLLLINSGLAVMYDEGTTCSSSQKGSSHNCPIGDGISACSQSCVDDGTGSLRWTRCAPDTSGYYRSAESTDILCKDTKDNNCDGLIDCEDSDCGGDRDSDGTCDNFDPDNDNDGVPDNAPDIEPNTPPNCKVDEHGQKIDGDVDGVCDFDKRSTDNYYIQIDQCLGTTCGVGAVVTDYSSNRVGCPKDCASCPTDPSCKACEKCSTWFADPCSPEECFSIGIDNGGCYYISGVAGSSYGASCSSCGNLEITDSSSCSVYNIFNEESCLANQCLNPGNNDPTLPRCEWKGRSTKCENIDMNTYYRDADQDGYGNQNNHIDAYEPPPGYIAAREDGKWDCVNGDNDINIHMDAEELCDGKDNNCDSTTDDSTICACTPQTTQKCPLPQSNPSCIQTCTDQGQWSSCDTSKAGQENTQPLCSDSIDNDCDGYIDCADPDCGGNGQTGSGNWDATSETTKICDNFDIDDDNDGINDFNDDGTKLDQEQITPLGCSIDALGEKIDEDGDNVCDNLENSACLGTIPTCVPYIDKNPISNKYGCPRDGACEISGCFRDPFCRGGTPEAGCGECGGPTLDFNLCDRNECLAISDYIDRGCYFDPAVLSRYGTCNSCDSTTICSNYDPGECTRDPCKLGCQWNQERKVCEETTKTVYYKDADGDGYGVANDNIPLASPQGEYTATISGDCDDSDPNRNPSEHEVCYDNKDNDCDDNTIDNIGDETGCNCIEGNDPTKDRDSDEFTDDIDAEDCTLAVCIPQDGKEGYLLTGKARDDDGDGVCDLIEKATDPINCLGTADGCGPVDKNPNSDKTGCPLSCSNRACVNDPYCRIRVQTSGCNSCSQDGYCSKEECSSLSEIVTSGCYFTGPLSGSGNCNSCASVTCSDYLSEVVCTTETTENICGVGPCLWINNNCCDNKNNDGKCDVPGDQITYYIDRDGDGYGKETASGSDIISSVIKPDGYADNKRDCNDENGEIKPGAQEVCDGINNDCDKDPAGIALVDEVCTEQEEKCTPGISQWCYPNAEQVSGCYHAYKECNEDGTFSDCRFIEEQKHEEIENTLESCSDNLDNDCDGAVNCEDPNCIAYDYNEDGEKKCEVTEGDDDGDTVLNDQDNELNTPHKCEVWKPGEKKDNVVIGRSFWGVKKDEDLDEVCNGRDECAHTPDKCDDVEVNGCPTQEACSSDPDCARASGCEGTTPSTGPGPGGQCSCKLVTDAGDCEENIVGTIAEEHGLVLTCNPTSDGKARILTELKIIDFNDPVALKADGINKYKIKCCTLKCATG